MKKETSESVLSLIRTLRFEFRELSSKKPNDQVNKFKLKYVNQAIEAANEVLQDNKPYADFDKFSEEDLPTNSDVLMMLSLYLDVL
jgi:hypothetical protein